MLLIGYADITDLTDFSLDKISCCLRSKYIESIVDEKRKRQCYYAWLLLSKMLLQLNININSLDFNVKEGKWYCINSNIFFNISHSNNIVAVSLSDETDNAVDVQVCRESILKTAKKYCKNQLKKIENMSDILACTQAWTLFELGYKGNFENKVSFETKDKLQNSYILSFSYKNKIDYSVKNYTL